MDVRNINVIALAYLGDSVFEVYVRNKLINSGIYKVDLLQKRAIYYVSAKGQARILRNLIDNNFLTEEELEVVHRGRNYKRSAHPKNTDIVTYKMSTGFEALIGFLYLKNDNARINEIFEEIGVE
mgnify:CR=1 FL=1